jgi:hypothetical protein
MPAVTTRHSPWRSIACPVLYQTIHVERDIYSTATPAAATLIGVDPVIAGRREAPISWLRPLSAASAHMFQMTAEEVRDQYCNYELNVQTE